MDLGQIAREVLSELETCLERTGGRVEPGDLPVIEADPLQMRLLFQNLLGNALKFHRPDEPPLVRVWSRPQNLRARQGVQIFFADNGIGFDLKHLQRIFLPFERLTGRSEFEGSGMGSAICQKIVEPHGGRTTAESASGEGATFLVTLPGRQPS